MNMDPNKSYCHGSSSQLQQPNSISSTSSAASSSSQQQQQQQQQQLHHQHQHGGGGGGGGGVVSIGVGGEMISSKPNNKSQLNNNQSTGNYINVVPVPIGVQYHRRKLTPQDYQPRLYYNNSDYRCRDDFYPTTAATATANAPTVAGTPAAGAGAANNNNNNNNIGSTSQQQFHQHQHHHHHHQHQQIDIVEQTINNSRVAATQTSNNFLNTCDQQQQVSNVMTNIATNNNNNQNNNNNSNHNNVNNSNSNNSVGCSTPIQQQQQQQQPPPVLYTVHRVVTTAQIQTAGGNTFATSSSVSSVVSAVRNEADCNSNNNGLMPPNGANGLAGVGVGVGVGGVVNNNSTNNNNNINNGGVNNGSTSSAGLHSSPGVSTNSNFQQATCSQDGQQSTSNISNNYNSTTTQSTSANYSIGAKSSTSIPRPLQNVIPTCVYLMSRIAVHMEIEGTAQCPAQVMLAAALGCEELGIANKLLAQSIFGLWMTSALLEIQLKSQHRPYVVRVAWPHLLNKFSHSNPIEKRFDEPMIVLKRNVFFSKKDEEKIKDHRILELLYEEAKHNVLMGRYIMEPVHSIMLGGIQSRIELGPYNSHTHTISFFRENQSRFLPQHVAKSSSWSWLPVSRKNSAEVKLLEQYKRVPQTATTRKLMRKYLEFCWALPFYGASFFHGQVEQPVRGLLSLMNHKDTSVIVAINERGVYIIDPIECTLLLGLRYEDLSWDYAKPSSNDDSDCQTCIFLQFDAVENGIPVSKLMQIFSRQAAMMDALIANFADQMRRRREGVDGQPMEHVHDEPNPIQNNGNGILCNKLSRLTLATFDDEGRCIGQMGSLSISY